MAKNLSYRHILKYTGVFGGIQAINVLSSVLRNKAAAILIDRYGQGISELFNSTINLVSSATTLIIPVAIVRKISFLFEKLGLNSVSVVHTVKVIRSWSVLTGILGTLLVMLSCPLLSRITCDSHEFTKSYFFLSPMLLMLSVNGTEVAILKATRQLKQLVTASFIGSFSTLIICVVSYYFWSIRGVVISLNASLFVITMLNIKYSTRFFPYKVSPFCKKILLQGKSLIKLSVSFMLAALIAALSETLIRTYISQSGSIENVGLYAAGFALTVTYTRFIFNAMDADYYPHLAGICSDKVLMNTAVNKQITVCVQLIVPCLLLFVLFLPEVITLFYTHKYLEIVPMVICGTIYMFCKAVITPIAYVALAKADSKMYLVIESISAIILGTSVVVGYEYYSLKGCGIGLSFSNLVDAIIIYTVYYKRYNIRMRKNTMFALICQFLILVIGICAIYFCKEYSLKLTIVLLAILSSVILSVLSLYKKINS